MSHAHVTLKYGGTPGNRAPLSFVLERDDGATALVQSDWQRPHLAQVLGWHMPDHLDPDHGVDVELIIDAASNWLHERDGQTFFVPDEELDVYDWADPNE